MENNIPSSWREIPLEEIIVHILGGDWGSDLTENFSDEFEAVKVVRGTDFKDWQSKKAQNAPIRLLKKKSLDKRKLISGDIVLEVSGGGPDQPVGRTIIIDEHALSEGFPMVCSNFFRQFRIQPSISPFYIQYYLKYSYANGSFNDFQTQTTNLRNLNVNDFISKTIIPIAPKDEQDLIVAKLDAIMLKVEANKQRLEKIPKLLKRFRQAVLAAAVSGRLTEEWREENPVLPVLQYKEFKTKYQSEDLPESWAMIKVEEYLDNYDKGRIPVSQDIRKKRKGNYPYYGATGIIDSIDGFTHDGEFILLSEDGMNLLYRTKPQALLAKGKIWVNNHAHVLKAKSGFENKYAEMCFNSIDIAPYLTGIDQVKLTQGNLNTIELPVAPKEEQIEIVRISEQLLSFADKIESRYLKAKAMLDRLPQSILGKAFRGELVD